jgi:copper oxidase (laccase) domain-containing protein
MLLPAYLPQPSHPIAAVRYCTLRMSAKFSSHRRKTVHCACQRTSVHMDVRRYCTLRMSAEFSSYIRKKILYTAHVSGVEFTFVSLHLRSKCTYRPIEVQ